MVGGEIALVGHSEAQVSDEIGRRLLAEGHQRVNFAIVGSGPNSASPHHDAGPRVIGPGEAVVCDFGGTMNGYCSDITRTVITGEPPAEFLRPLRVLQRGPGAESVAAAEVGTACQDVDAAARRIIADAGYGEYFIHRTGHGIGLEEHEDPYIVAGNRQPLVAGHAFSVEPGIYLPGPVRRPDRGHRGGHGRRPEVAEFGRPRPGHRRVLPPSVTPSQHSHPVSKREVGGGSRHSG